MDISLFDIVGNGISNEEITKDIISKLQEKYKKEFIVKRIGNRYGIRDNEWVTTYCCPKDNESLNFSAMVNREKTQFKDNYRIRSVSYELEKNISEQFKKNNIEVIVRTEIIGKNELSEFISVQDFINKYKGTNFLTYIIIKDIVMDEDLLKVYDYLNDKYKNIYFKSLIYMIDKEDFAECYETVKTLPLVTNSIIQKYSIKDKSSIKIREGQIEKL